MSSRAAILKKININKPEFVELDRIDTRIFEKPIDTLETFKNQVEVVGGKVFLANSSIEVLKQVNVQFPKTITNYSTLNNSDSFNSIDLEQIKKPHDLENLDVLVLKGEFGVAENGAIWLTDEQIPIRVLPFITKNLVLVIDKTKIVSDMHQAYERLKNISYTYGVFISGPSKTADIEQSLVIGAQGALSLSVFIIY